MSETYTIKAVKPEPKQWQSQYGPMVTYTVMFEGRELPVEVNKKQESPAPKVGDEVFGDINRTEYGDKFKSAPKPFGGGGGAKGGYTPKSQDTFTMYLSYAKDIALSCISADAKGTLQFDDTLYGEVLGAVEAGGAQLYGSRPDAPQSTDAPKEEKKETDADLLKNIDKVFGDEEPWQEPA